MSHKKEALFLPSGCLSGEALTLFAAGQLPGNDLLRAQQHIETCPLCKDAAEGYLLWEKENRKGAELLTREDAAAAGRKGGGHFSKPDLNSHTRSINEHINKYVRAKNHMDLVKKRQKYAETFVWIADIITVILFLLIFYATWINRKLQFPDNNKNKTTQDSVLQNKPDFQPKDTIQLNKNQKDSIAEKTPKCF